MDMPEFDALAEPLRRESAATEARYGMKAIDGFTATAAEIAAVEAALGVTLPDRYKAFMSRYGGGLFGFVELFPVAAVAGERIDDLLTVNDLEFPDRSFVAVAPVGTGDHWCFPVTAGRCHEEVWFHFHDDPAHEPIAADFLEFVAHHGLRPAR